MKTEKRDVFYTYVEDNRVIEQVQERFGQTCVIVATIPDPIDDHPTTDRYRIRFLDGATLEVFPEELLPIPQADTERQAVFTSTIVVDYDDSKETPQEALESYAADNDIVASFEIQKNIGQGQEGNV